ncbi:aminotransferase class V-fold PLP-dependent enzyme [Alkalihalobacillus sp. AL-G]|uniref:aminotransferase class V-fold PLP-dependent enzyme n=1 Tax=Alkalihalobacillus sp. AL-G TaxID=2926399 RepID=UPI002729A287|nr:aminotransferase class V-fold PLP-dependent enzyme [Alkalihalobacillus sp. AL-G]WLD94762.1 aminotransferase class V-fold PLP-dependent enzyme [Alkalihalobacillus sp. AL-G]
MLQPQDYRNHFPILKNRIQLSSCSQSALHFQVKQAIHDYVKSWEENGMNWESWVDACEQARDKFATLINADPDEIAIVSSVSHAVSAIASSLSEGHSERDEIIINEADFPCVGHVWLSHTNFHVKFMSGEQPIEPETYYKKFVSEQTLLTSVSHISYYNGSRLELDKISKVVHSKGSYLFVDAYQSAGQVEVDVKRDNIDFLATGTQKYLLGVPGIAFLYVKKEIAEQLTPKVTGWFGQENPFAFDIKQVKYAQGARRFDSGTPAMMNGFAANSALEVILDVGIDRIEAHLKELSEHTYQQAIRYGMTVKSPASPTDRGSMIAVLTPNAPEVEKQLKEQNIIVSARNDVIRIAPHFYNTKEDINCALQALEKDLKTRPTTVD